MVDPAPSTEAHSLTLARRLPAVIQGGMGAAISNWRLARAVAMAGGLGVISGTAIDRIVAYRLQEGDEGGHCRRALAAFPVPALAQRILDRWYVPGGIARAGAYRQTPAIGQRPGTDSLELLVAAGFVEVTLAKEGHAGKVGINLLEKLQTPNPAILYGALLAGVDAVLMGAGIPREIPALLASLAAHRPGRLALRVEGALSGESTWIEFAPAEILAGTAPPLVRPPFLAIISSEVLAMSLLRSCGGAVDGFVVEGPTAGGHNAPPRGGGTLNEHGEPVYGPRDVADLARLRQLDRPFWLAGGYAVPGGLARARAAGAQGVQVGTAFAISQESGLTAELKQRMLAQPALRVFTDPRASPTGFPFKVCEVPGTLADPTVYAARRRICNLGYLRQAYRLPDGGIGWRCPAEPEDAFLAKGGDPAELVGRKCLCNGLMATAGLALATAAGGREPPLVTTGDAINEVIAAAGRQVRGAGEVLAALLAEDASPPAPGGLDNSTKLNKSIRS